MHGVYRDQREWKRRQRFDERGVPCGKRQERDGVQGCLSVGFGLIVMGYFLETGLMGKDEEAKRIP